MKEEVPSLLLIAMLMANKLVNYLMWLFYYGILRHHHFVAIRGSYNLVPTKKRSTDYIHDIVTSLCRNIQVCVV